MIPTRPFTINDDCSQFMTQELLNLIKQSPLTSPQMFLNIYYGLVFDNTDTIVQCHAVLPPDQQALINLEYNRIRGNQTIADKGYVMRFNRSNVSKKLIDLIEYDYENDCTKGTDIINMTVNCYVTGAAFPRSELVKAKAALAWETKTVWIHPSVVDNAELSKFVTTITGMITTKNVCYQAEDADGKDIYLAHEERYLANEYGYFICDDCGTLTSLDDHHRDHNGNSICNNCIEDHYSSCPNCDAWLPDNDYDDDDNGCNNCGYGRAVIHDYNYKPRPLFRGDNSIKYPYIGFELEIEARGESRKYLAKKVLELFPDEDHLYNKYDSSLDSGVEIVSHPMTLEYHLTQDYSTLFRKLTRMGGRSHNTSTCGLHFHLDKSRMTDAHKVRFGAFFALARHKLEVLARRSCESYAAFKPKTCSLTEFISEENRYQAVNWSNSNTVEVRIFKGTLKYETFMASMELCQAIYSFTQKSSAFICEFEENAIWDRFNKFVTRSKPKEFTFLKAFMEEKAELLAKAIEKDADIVKIEQNKTIKRKKLRLTDNVVEATLMTEQQSRRPNSPVFMRDDIYTVNEITNRYNSYSDSPIRINLDADYIHNTDY